MKFICSSQFCFSFVLEKVYALYESDAYCAGVARGCGWQHLAVYANLGTFYCIGMPIAILLGFKLKLYAKVLISILRAHTLLNRYFSFGCSVNRISSLRALFSYRACGWV